jgi:dihydropyrimidinase
VYDLVLTGGQVVSPDLTHRADVAISDGKIAAIGEPRSFADAEREIDVSGKYVLPGLIDSHVHLNLSLGDFTTRDSWAAGTTSAALGGVTCLVDFAIPNSGELPLAAFERRLNEAEGQSVIDYGLHACTSRADAKALAEIPRLIDMGAATVKMFTVYRGLVMLTYGEVRAVLQQIGEHGGLAAFHAEDAAIIEYEIQRHVSEGCTKPIHHARSRPVVAEVAAMQVLGELLYETGAAGFFVHVSSGEAERVLRMARRSGVSLYAETCPHYLLLTEEVYEHPDGQNFICSPPIRPEPHPEALWEMVSRGSIQMINTDHCCYDREQKSLHKDDFPKAPNGLPGVETRFPLLYTEGVQTGRISLGQLVSLTSTNVAKLMGLFPQKGTIQVGGDADVVVIDPATQRTVSAADLHMATDYTPFEGRKAVGWPVLTMSRGRIVVEDGRFCGEASHGRYVPRRIDESVIAGGVFSPERNGGDEL